MIGTHDTHRDNDFTDNESHDKTLQKLVTTTTTITLAMTSQTFN